MKLGLYLRNMGPQSTRPLIADAARAAEEAGIDDLWVADHLALAPEDAEGSDGRYLEPLATLAFLAGITERVALAVGVLIVPYRPALLSAKWIASIQELSGGRLILGVGVGWMERGCAPPAPQATDRAGPAKPFPLRWIGPRLHPPRPSPAIACRADWRSSERPWRRPRRRRTRRRRRHVGFMAWVPESAGGADQQGARVGSPEAN